MLLDGYPLPQCGYLQLFILITWSCLAPHSCSCRRAAIFLTPVWLDFPASVPASYHERGHFIALGLQPLLSLLLHLRVMAIIFLLGFNRTSLSLLRTADVSTRDGRSCMDQHMKHICAIQSPRLIEVMGSLAQPSSFIRCSPAQMSIGGH